MMTLVGMIASPTFVIINGMSLGMVYRTRTHDFERLRTIVTDRGLFQELWGQVVRETPRPGELPASISH